MDHDFSPDSANNEASGDANWRLIREDLEKLRADLARLGEKSLSEGQEKITDELADLRAKAAALADKVNSRGRAAHEDLIGYIQSNPITSIGGAFGLGLLVAALLGRRS